MAPDAPLPNLPAHAHDTELGTKKVRETLTGRSGLSLADSSNSSHNSTSNPNKTIGGDDVTAAPSPRDYSQEELRTRLGTYDSCRIASGSPTMADCGRSFSQTPSGTKDQDGTSGDEAMPARDCASPPSLSPLDNKRADASPSAKPSVPNGAAAERLNIDRHNKGGNPANANSPETQEAPQPAHSAAWRRKNASPLADSHPSARPTGAGPPSQVRLKPKPQQPTSISLPGGSATSEVPHSGGAYVGHRHHPYHHLGGAGSPSERWPVYGSTAHGPGVLCACVVSVRVLCVVRASLRTSVSVFAHAVCVRL